MSDPGDPTPTHHRWCAPTCVGPPHRSRSLEADGVTVTLLLAHPHVAVEVARVGDRRLYDVLNVPAEHAEALRALLADTLHGAM